MTDLSDDIRYKDVTCARCNRTSQCTPFNDFYLTPLWEGPGRVCERCMKQLMYYDIKVREEYK